MSVRSLRAVVRRTPVLVGAAALSVTLLAAGCAEEEVGEEEILEEEVLEEEPELEE